MLQVTPRPLAPERRWRVHRHLIATTARYRRYLIALVAAIGPVWLLAAAYLTVAPVSYTSKMTLILPGSGAGGTLNVDSIGNASAVTASPFSGTTLSPTENYKRLLASGNTLARGVRLAGENGPPLAPPDVKLIDQTNLIEIAIRGPTARTAQRRALGLRDAFLAELDRLRADEANHRETADRRHLAELQAKVREAQGRVLRFQGSTGLVSLEQFNARVSALDGLRDCERQARAQQAQSLATTERLARTLGISPGAARRAFLLKADPLFQGLLQRYAAATASETEQGGTLGPAHATMRELAAARASLQAALVARGAALTGLPARTLLSFADLSVTEGRARMFETLIADDASAAGAGGALAEVRAQIGAQAAASGRLVEEAGRLAELVRDERVAEAVFSSALARLDTNKSDPFASYPLVQTLEEPSLPDKRTSPSRLLALGGAVAATFMIMMGFGLLWLRRPILRRLLPNG